ncbi:MAG: hypothetical protein ABEK36_03140 [Candidatus Aenigmatarchaeota archaeon]|jgi:hypothetical protein
MMDNKKRNIFIDSFCNFMSEPEPFTKEEIRNELEEIGINTESLIDEALKIAHEGSKERRLAWKKKAQENRKRIEKVIESKKTKEIKKSIKDKLKEILAGSYGKEAQTFAESYFRKMEALTNSDLEKIIEDMENLNLLNEIIKEND